LASKQLAQLLFVQIIRFYLATSGPLRTGWLRALNDERVAPALRDMHREPGRAWQLGELAKQVGNVVGATMFRPRGFVLYRPQSGRAPRGEWDEGPPLGLGSGWDPEAVDRHLDAEAGYRHWPACTAEIPRGAQACPDCGLAVSADPEAEEDL
jgi:hypothetical protein